MPRRQPPSANPRAYVLIETEPGQIDAAVAALHGLPAIVTVDAVIGPCDIIAIVETSDQNAIGRLVIDNIHAISGIKRTTTCFVIR